MKITIGIYTGQKNFVKKKYTVKHTYSNCMLKDATSIRRPTIVIHTSSSGVKNLTSGDSKCNYMYIAEFGRYYYITDIRSIRTSIVEIDAISDPLKSFWSGSGSLKGIKDNVGYIDKTATTSIRSKYLDDGSFRAYSTPNISTVPFTGDRFTTTQQFVAIIAGGSTEKS